MSGIVSYVGPIPPTIVVVEMVMFKRKILRLRNDDKRRGSRSTSNLLPLPSPSLGTHHPSHEVGESNVTNPSVEGLDIPRSNQCLNRQSVLRFTCLHSILNHKSHVY